MCDSSCLPCIIGTVGDYEPDVIAAWNELALRYTAHVGIVSALEKIRVKAEREYLVPIGNQGGWGYVEMIAEDALRDAGVKL
jgi:hypothetical protein